MNAEPARFTRVECSVCAKLCLPDHAPEHVVQQRIDGTGESMIARLCRIPVGAHPTDGGYTYAGCSIDYAQHARVISDPYAGMRAPAPLSL